MFYLKAKPSIYQQESDLYKERILTVFPGGKVSQEYKHTIILKDLLRMVFVDSFEYTEKQMLVKGKNGDIFIVETDQFLIVPYYIYETNEVY